MGAEKLRISHGYRAYTIEDPGGHHWTIAQALPSMVHPSAT